jgi:hypothetical protein
MTADRPSLTAGSRGRPTGAGWGSWRLHLFGTVAVCGCLAAGYVELQRALAGNPLSWVYTGEWPLFAGLGIHVWAKLLRERHAEARPGPRPPGNRGPAGGSGRDPVDDHADDHADVELQAWRSYVADLQTHDPPGGPPW